MTPDLASPSASREGTGVDGGFPLAAEDFRRIAAILHAEAGVALHQRQSALVHARLTRRLRTVGLRSFRDYCALVADDAGIDERQRMLAALTTDPAPFFREPHHFDHLRATVLPPLLAAARRGARVRLWSAACAGGSEPYSMAMVVLDLLPEAADLDVKILASDVDPEMVTFARSGRHPASALQRAPAGSVRRWFKPLGPGSDALEAGAELRRLIAFRELDLIGEWPMRGRFDAIFCRNVAIYFERDAQHRLWSRLAPLLTPGGRLYIGRSERLAGPAADLFTAEGAAIHRLA